MIYSPPKCLLMRPLGHAGPPTTRPTLPKGSNPRPRLWLVKLSPDASACRKWRIFDGVQRRDRSNVWSSWSRNRSVCDWSWLRRRRSRLRNEEYAEVEVEEAQHLAGIHASAAEQARWAPWRLCTRILVYPLSVFSRPPTSIRNVLSPRLRTRSGPL